MKRSQSRSIAYVLQDGCGLVHSARRPAQGDVRRRYRSVWVASDRNVANGAAGSCAWSRARARWSTGGGARRTAPAICAPAERGPRLSRTLMAACSAGQLRSWPGGYRVNRSKHARPFARFVPGPVHKIDAACGHMRVRRPSRRDGLSIINRSALSNGVHRTGRAIGPRTVNGRTTLQ